MFVFFRKRDARWYSVISNRCLRANNLNLKPGDYNSLKPHSFICCLDANNLYGWAMSQYLPTGGFRFLADEEIANFDFANIQDDSKIGYVMECDLEYPAELHEMPNDYPLAPEHMTITADMLSPFCKAMNLKCAFTEKLMGTLQTKIKYEVHCQNLKLYVKLCMKGFRTHRVTAFEQRPRLKAYIHLNTLMRQRAKFACEKDFYKLMNNGFLAKA
jgi:hypothetical protein